MNDKQKYMVFGHAVQWCEGRPPLIGLMAAVSGGNDAMTIASALRRMGAMEGDTLERRPVYVEATSPYAAIRKIGQKLDSGEMDPVDQGKLKAFVPEFSGESLLQYVQAHDVDGPLSITRLNPRPSSPCSRPAV